VNNPFSIEGKNVLITGAASGIGRQCAISCSQMGANLILVDINKQGMDKTLLLLSPKNHIAFQQDITRYDELDTIVNDAVMKVGKISGFIHSVGIEMTLPLKMLKPQSYEKIYSINVISALSLAKIISKKKYIGKNASFVFISSIMAQLGQPGKIAYCSSKGALVSGARAMALELAVKNIRVNSILPGLVKTKMSLSLFESLSKDALSDIESMHPLGFGYIEDVANACIYLLSFASKWVTGTSLIVDGGYSAK
jgi:NAD(P)-dependent dehydrogenase (short-subunit alcohol dehydrogenase family)